jgi:RHS repeat-associated protein
MTYDNAGNTTQRTINGVVTDFTYNTENRFATATVHASGGDQLTSHLYSASGALLLRKDPTGTTLYAAGQEYKLTGASTKTATRYYTHGGATVAVRNPTGLSWLAADHQASTNITVNTTTGAVQHRWYTPYGDNRATQGTWPTDRGFLNKQTNTSTSLLDVGAREYDPNLGTFLSPDPLIVVDDPVTFNAYAYANHSPVAKSDPTGLRTCSGPDECAGDPIDKGNPAMHKRPHTPFEDFISSQSGGGLTEAQYKMLHDHMGYNGSPNFTWAEALEWSAGNPDAWLWTCQHAGGTSEQCGQSPFTGEDLNDTAGTEMAVLTGVIIGGGLVIGCTLAPEACLAAVTAGVIMAGEATMGYATGTIYISGVSGTAALAGLRLLMSEFGSTLVFAAGRVPITSAISEDAVLVKAAQQAGKNQRIQQEMDALQVQLMFGNMNPGLETKYLGNGIYYARGGNGARLYFRNFGGGVQIVGKSDKGNQDAVIGRLNAIYKQ